MDLRLCESKKGRESWKFNNTLLKNKDFIKLVKNEICLIKQTYALPVYNPEAVLTMNELQLELIISDSLFLDTMLCQLRGSIISFSKRIARETRKEEKSLEIDINNLIIQIEACESINDITILNNRLSEKQEHYEGLREIRMRGHQVRSRSEIMATWEKPSRYFLNLEKKHYINKTIVELITENDHKITDPKKFLELQKDFYQNLFSSKKTIKIENSYFEQYLSNLTKLSSEMRNKLEETFSLDELECVIKESK